MTTGLNGSSSPHEKSAMTLGERVLPVTPELLKKYGNGFQGMENGGIPGSENQLVTALEKKIDGSKEIILAEENKQDIHLDHVIDIDTPQPQTPQEATELIVVSESSTELPRIYQPTYSSPRNSNPTLFDVIVDITETPNDGLDNVSTDSDQGFLLMPESVNRRRSSGWSAHVLFLATDVQLVVNLADYAPEDAFETKPTPNEDDAEDDNMPHDKDDVELQPIEPLKSKDNPPIQNYSSDQTNGGFTQLCDNNGYPPPPYGNPENGDNFDNTDSHSLVNNICDNDKDDDDGKKSVSSDDSQPPREDWGHKADFLLAVIGYAVDLSNVWRFPYLCYRNGGGAFIIPYFTVLVLGALPVFFMELCLGQFHREGPITVWKIAPIFKGIGYASCFLAYIVAFYYNVVIGWAFFYLFSSFTSDLPWNSCDNEWNTNNCWKLDEGRYNSSAAENITANATRELNISVSSSFEFFERGMLQLHLSGGIDRLGAIRWQLVLCTLLTFICLYFSLWKGVKSSGKVVYVTATMPYIILTILLIRGCLLPGAVEGMKYFITPNLERLNDPQVWIDAAIQIMFSIGAGFGTHIAYASHNKFTNNCYLDCLFTAAVNSFTSIFSGFVVFSYLGYMADRQQKHISLVAQEGGSSTHFHGPGLVFIVYPEAIATLPGSTAWSIIFFIMLITLGLDSAFGGLESPLTGVNDQFYKRFKKKWSRELLTFIIVFSAFICSIPCSTAGGMYVFKILDTFAAGTSILFTVLCQVIAVSWFYGIDQFCSDISKMIGFSPGLYWRICWKFLTPTFLLIIVISSIMHYEPLTYQGSNTTYVYPEYANILGWIIACTSMSIIPLYAIYYICTARGTAKERISLAISPKWEHKTIREDRQVKRFTRQHWVYI